MAVEVGAVEDHAVGGAAVALGGRDVDRAAGVAEQPQRTAAVTWESTEPGPAAMTAARRRPSGASVGWPTA